MTSPVDVVVSSGGVSVDVKDSDVMRDVVCDVTSEVGMVVSRKPQCNKQIHTCIQDFTARRYASVVYAVIVCLSVCLCVCPCVTLRYCIDMDAQIELCSAPVLHH